MEIESHYTSFVEDQFGHHLLFTKANILGLNPIIVIYLLDQPERPN